MPACGAVAMRAAHGKPAMPSDGGGDRVDTLGAALDVQLARCGQRSTHRARASSTHQFHRYIGEHVASVTYAHAPATSSTSKCANALPLSGAIGALASRA